MYIIPILAALEMRTVITRNCSEDDILSVACALRQVKHGQWLPLVKRLIVPISHISRLPASYFSAFPLFYRTPKPQGESSHISTYTFGQKEQLDQLFTAVETHYPKLPERSTEWNSQSIDPWLYYPVADPPSTLTIKTPLIFKKTKLPFSQKNRDSFTDKERVKVSKAPVAQTLEDLASKLNDLHAGGKRKANGYVGMKTSLAEGKPLFIRDKEGKLLTLSLTVPPHIKKALEDAILLIQAAMPGEFQDEDSKRSMFQYLSCHYTWYARFAENGSGAPKDVHPHNLRKGHEKKVNYDQRFPHQAKLMRERREEFLILAQAYENFFEWLRPELQRLLPEEFDQLSIWCEVLPLASNCPAAPFGGFVLNLNACTWAHRDGGDKILCVVIPFGNFEGGELVLYEVGFFWDLRMGDVLIFPSCELTHFNLHFKGKRGTLVLHTDRQSDAWIGDHNGWSCHVVTVK